MPRQPRRRTAGPSPALRKRGGQRLNSLFLEQAASKPREAAALAPSSRALARRMAEAVPEGPASIVEPGAGAGKGPAAPRLGRLP